MAAILMGKARDPELDSGALDAMFRLRHCVFHERLGWDVNSSDGMEIDLYDDLDPVYMIARNESRRVEGCWRLLPTTGSYMLRDTFPELLAGEELPSDERVWELSRFAVAPTSSSDCRQANFSDVTFSMMQQVVQYADDNGIDAYVTVTSVALERMLRRAGIPLQRFGDGKARRIGRVLSVACWIPINAQCRAAVWHDEVAFAGSAA